MCIDYSVQNIDPIDISTVGIGVPVLDIDTDGDVGDHIIRVVGRQFVLIVQILGKCISCDAPAFYEAALLFLIRKANDLAEKQFITSCYKLP